VNQLVDTPYGPAGYEVHRSDSATAALLLGHGAGGGFGAPDLVAATKAANGAGIDVVHITQPYRIAGRRTPAPAQQLDAAWLATVAHLAANELHGVPMIFGGRSSGARVACRTAAEGKAIAVLCLAFPVHPPGKPHNTRLDELDQVTQPVLVVQGERDPFGRPPPHPGRELVLLPGDHGLKGDLPALGRAVTDWLTRALGMSR
jgi:uncharacterized protein